jgi:MFS family permease
MADLTLGSNPASTPKGYPGYGAKPYRAYILAVLMVIYGLNLMDRSLVALLQEKFKPEFHLSDFQLGLLGGPAFAFFNTVASLPIGRLADRFNRIGILSICVAAWSLMTALCGLATSFPMLLLARFGVGVGEAGCLPPSQSVISDYFPSNKRASAIAIHLISIPIGTILASMIGAVVADRYGWRMAFIALGAPGLLIALVCRLTVKEPPRGATMAADGQPAATPSLRAALRELGSKSSFFHIALATGLVNFVAVGNGQYLVSFLLRAHHVSLTQVGLILGPLVGGLTVVSGIVVGKALDYLTARNRAWLARWPAIGVLLAAPLGVVSYLTPSLPMMIALLLAQLLCIGAYLTSLYTTAQGVVQPAVRGTASAMVIVVINTIGYGFGPPAIGALSDFMQAHVVAFGLSDAAHAGAQGLRYAMACGMAVNLWAAVHYWIGSTKLERDWAG